MSFAKQAGSRFEVWATPYSHVYTPTRSTQTHAHMHATTHTNTDRALDAFIHTWNPKIRFSVYINTHTHTHTHTHTLPSTPTLLLPLFPKPQTPTHCLLIQLNHSQVWIVTCTPWREVGDVCVCASVFFVWIRKLHDLLCHGPSCLLW